MKLYSSTFTVNVTFIIEQLIATNEAEGFITLKMYELVVSHIQYTALHNAIIYECSSGTTTDWPGILKTTTASNEYSSMATRSGDHNWLACNCMSLSTVTSLIFLLSYSMEIIDTPRQPPPLSVTPDGSVVYATPMTTKILCAFQVAAFPFDSQTCAWIVQTNAQYLPTMDMYVASNILFIQPYAVDSPGLLELTVNFTVLLEIDLFSLDTNILERFS